MSAKKLFEYILLSILVTFTLVFASACCSGEDDDDDEVHINSRLIVENGIEAIWLNEENTEFLFCYSSAEPEGIYSSDLEGNVTTIFEGPHNHNYSPSPDGQKICFSSPDLNSGAVVVDLLSQSEPLVIAWGNSPSWIDNDHILYVSNNGMITKANVTSENVEYETFVEGVMPKAQPNGDYYTFLRLSSSTGMYLRMQSFSDEDIYKYLGQRIGNDYIWYPNGDYIIASQLDESDLHQNTSIYVVELNGEQNLTLLLSNASRPSVSGDGTHLFANDSSAGSISGIRYKNLNSYTTLTIPNFTYPCASANDKSFLAHNDGGIYLISF